jgi:hypothetical protein
MARTSRFFLPTVLLIVMPGLAAPRYVVMSNATPVAPYTNWPHAAATIQDAVDVSSAGDVVLVSNGTYAAGQVLAPEGSPYARVLATNGVIIRSVAGPDATTIVGQGPLASNAVRGVYLVNGALHGFTISNGHTAYAIFDIWLGSGGGVYASNALISNCVMVACQASSYGAGGCGGTYVDCVFRENGSNRYELTGGGLAQLTARPAAAQRCRFLNNSAKWGGGAMAHYLTDCAVVSNIAHGYGGGIIDSVAVATRLVGNRSTGTIRGGGGAYASVMTNCVITHNYSAIEGGGVDADSQCIDCLLTHNAAQNWGGASCLSSLYRCHVASNAAAYGGGILQGAAYTSLIHHNYATTRAGGAENAALYSCTIVRNEGPAGGVFGGTALNCVIYDNLGMAGPNVTNVTCTYTCTMPWQPGAGNLTNDPLFANPYVGDYTLLPLSLCHDAGQLESWMTGATDLAGNPRVVNGMVDLGCYENPMPESATIGWCALVCSAWRCTRRWPAHAHDRPC